MDNKNLNIIIIGYGFIGRSLEKYYKQISTNVKVIRATDGNFFHNLSLVSDIEIHLLLVTASITRLVGNSKESYEFNVKIASYITDICRRTTVSNLVYFSTIDVYGQTVDQEPISESTSLSPEDYYSKSKLKAEQIIRNGCHGLGTKLYILRLAGVFGEFDKNKSIISKMINDAMLTNKITITVSPIIYRDYIYINDLVRIIDKLTKGPETGVLNLTTGNSRTLSEIGRIISTNFTRIKIIEQTQENTVRSPKLFFDSRKLRSFVDFNFTPLEQSCKNIVLSKLRS